MNPLAAAVLAAGELICEFSDGYRKSYLAEMTGEASRAEQVLVYESLSSERAEVLSSRRPGRRPVTLRAAGDALHLIQRDGPSVRVTTLTQCTRHKLNREGVEVCTRFAASHAWFFDTRFHLDPAASLARLPSGAATGSCEPWRVE